MKRALLLCTLGAATATLAAMPAHADTFDFSFTGSTFYGSGTIDATETSPGSGVYQIDDMTGTLALSDGSGSSDIAGLIAPSGYLDNDNLLDYPGSVTGSGSTSYFDTNGVAFILEDGDKVALYTTASGITTPEVTGTDPNRTVSEDISETVTPAATPEPGSLALLGTAILGAAGILRRRFAA